MNNESYRETSAVNEITSEILSSRYEINGKIRIEVVRDIVKFEFNKLGGENAMGSTLLWVTYGKKDLLKNALERLVEERGK